MTLYFVYFNEHIPQSHPTFCGIDLESKDRFRVIISCGQKIIDTDAGAAQHETAAGVLRKIPTIIRGSPLLGGQLKLWLDIPVKPKGFKSFHECLQCITNKQGRIEVGQITLGEDSSIV